MVKHSATPSCVVPILASWLSGCKSIGVEIEFYLVDENAQPIADGIKLLLKEGDEVPQSSTFLAFDPAHTQVYEDGWIAGAHR